MAIFSRHSQNQAQPDQPVAPTAAVARPSEPVAGPHQPLPKSDDQVKKLPKQLPSVRADRETKEYILESLSMMLSSGVTVGEALDSILSELPSKSAKKAVQSIQIQINEGASLSAAIAASGLFNQSVVSLIEVGENSGRLPENLRVIAGQMHKTSVMNAKIKSAMLYPAFLVGLLFVVGTGVGVFLLPRLLNVLHSLQVKVGLITKIIIIAGTFFGHYGVILVIGVVVSGVLVSILIRRNTDARIVGESIVYQIPGIKKLLFETEVSRFGFILGTLLESGLPVVVALQSLASSMVTYRYRRFATNLCTRIEEGSSFGEVLSEPQYKKLLPATIRQLIISAEKSGNLSSSLLKIGQIYEDKADITARNLETLLEPVILVILAVCVLFVALAVILPIYSLVGGVNK